LIVAWFCAITASRDGWQPAAQRLPRQGKFASPAVHWHS
jgi:hypothetical protein